MQPEEIHAHLGQLSENGLVVVTVPPVGAFGKIVEWLDAPPIEQRSSRFVQRWPFQRNLSIGYDVAVQVKPDSQVFGQTIRTIERTELIATNDEQHGPILQLNCLQSILLRLKAAKLQAFVGQLEGLHGTFAHGNDVTVCSLRSVPQRSATDLPFANRHSVGLLSLPAFRWHPPFGRRSRPLVWPRPFEASRSGYREGQLRSER